MQLALLDWIMIPLYMVFAIGVGIFFSKRAAKNITEFFISGWNLPWWIAGTSMVATTIAADTPLFVSGVIAKEGIAAKFVDLHVFSFVSDRPPKRRAGAHFPIERNEIFFRDGPGQKFPNWNSRRLFHSLAF